MTSTLRHTSKALLACLFSSIKSHTSPSLAFSCRLSGWWEKNKRFLNFNKSPLISSLSIKAAPHSLPSRSVIYMVMASSAQGQIGNFAGARLPAWPWAEGEGRGSAPARCQQQGNQLLSAGEAQGEPCQGAEGSPRHPPALGSV